MKLDHQQDETGTILRGMVVSLIGLLGIPFFIAIFVLASSKCQGGEVAVKWIAQDGVTGYRVWRGIEKLADVATNRAVVTLPNDQLTTLTVTAYNNAGESDPSDPLLLTPVQAMESDDLVNWRFRGTVFYSTVTARKFYRLKYISP